MGSGPADAAVEAGDHAQRLGEDRVGDGRGPDAMDAGGLEELLPGTRSSRRSTRRRRRREQPAARGPASRRDRAAASPSTASNRLRGSVGAAPTRSTRASSASSTAHKASCACCSTNRVTSNRTVRERIARRDAIEDGRFVGEEVAVASVLGDRARHDDDARDLALGELERLELDRLPVPVGMANAELAAQLGFEAVVEQLAQTVAAALEVVGVAELPDVAPHPGVGRG